MTTAFLQFLQPALALTSSPDFRRDLPALPGAASALYLAERVRREPQVLLVVTPDTATVSRLERELHLLAPDCTVHSLPDWETLPFDAFSPHQDIVSERLHTLIRLPKMQRGIVLVALPTLLLRLPPPSFVQLNSLVVKLGERIDLPALRRQLESAGYRCVAEVMEHGEFAVRGSIVDLFPMGSTTPYRLDFFDDELDAIRVFDTDSQVSGAKLDHIELLPAHEYPWNDEAIARFRQAFRGRFETTLHAESIYGQVSKAIAPAGIEYYLPLFFAEMATLFDYLPAHTALVTCGDLIKSAQQFWAELNNRYQERRVDPLRPLLAPHEVYLKEDEVFAALKNYARWHSETGKTLTDYSIAEPLPDLKLDARAAVPFARLANYLMEFHGRVLLCAESAGRREVLLPLLRQSGIEPLAVDGFEDFATGNVRIAMAVAALDQGFVSADKSLLLIAEPDLFGEQQVAQRRRRRKVADPDAIIKNLSELRIGDAVVHIDHGIGRYQGLQTLVAGGIEAEYLVLAYRGEDKLYVPVTSLHLIGRYLGAGTESAPWHKLGGEQWTKARQKAAEKIRDVAAELLDFYAKRAAHKGTPANWDKAEQLRFDAQFPFEITLDQETAIAAVLSDMKRDRPMDRLVCGDVGFGKTEVAMRAAFAAVQSGWQVAILVPTTLLAQQHYNSLCDRFADWPVRIEMLSRFKNAGETKKAIQEIADGKIDIVVGTHKLIQGDVKFDKLGLLIVDEEHRFGVRQKEQVKALRADVHMLTLTATPIPRTLNMSLSGIRDLSLITTPPAKRLAVKTFVRERNDALIKEAVTREIMRGGQVYVLHNDVDSIERQAETLQELLPDARIAIAHGQMGARDLERVMRDFYHQRFHILVCSTIIETGIDVPTANTIIIERADKLGLAQLHQLRGRVGRSHHQAYAYLLTPPKNLLSADAEKRLDAISAFDDLGAGFLLASQDLEIRGAGELLGEEQSGQIEGIGLSLYLELLDEAVKALKAGKKPSMQTANSRRTEIEAGIPALLPDIYVADVGMRLGLYKRMTLCQTDAELDDFCAELVDRFGSLPAATQNLLQLARLRLRATQIGIKRIELLPQGARIEFGQDASNEGSIDPMHLIGLVQKQPKRFRFDGPLHLRVAYEAKEAQPEAAARLNFIEQLLSTLSPTVNSGSGVKLNAVHK